MSLARARITTRNLTVWNQLTPTGEEWGKFSIKLSESFTHEVGLETLFKTRRLNEMMVGRTIRPKGGWEGVGSKDRNVVVDLGTVPLSNALCNPDDVPALLLLQLDVGVKNTEVELVEEGELVQLHLRQERD